MLLIVIGSIVEAFLCSQFDVVDKLYICALVYFIRVAFREIRNEKTNWSPLLRSQRLTVHPIDEKSSSANGFQRNTRVKIILRGVQA